MFCWPSVRINGSMLPKPMYPRAKFTTKSFSRESQTEAIEAMFSFFLKWFI